VVDGSGSFGIEKCGAGGDIHGCAEGGDVERDDVLAGQRGMDLDHAVVSGKRFAAHLEMVTAEGKIASGEFSGVVGGEGTVELKGVAGEFYRGSDPDAAGTDDLEVKVRGIALRQKRESEKKNSEVEQFAHDWMWGNIYATSFGEVGLSY